MRWAARTLSADPEGRLAWQVTGVVLMGCVAVCLAGSGGIGAMVSAARGTAGAAGGVACRAAGWLVPTMPTK